MKQSTKLTALLAACLLLLAALSSCRASSNDPLPASDEDLAVLHTYGQQAVDMIDEELRSDVYSQIVRGMGLPSGADDTIKELQTMDFRKPVHIDRITMAESMLELLAKYAEDPDMDFSSLSKGLRNRVNSMAWASFFALIRSRGGTDAIVLSSLYGGNASFDWDEGKLGTIDQYFYIFSYGSDWSAVVTFGTDGRGHASAGSSLLYWPQLDAASVETVATALKTIFPASDAPFTVERVK